MWIVVYGDRVERTVFMEAHRKRTLIEPADTEINLTKQEATDLYRKMAMAEYGSKIVLDNGLVFKVQEKSPTVEELLGAL
jgi:hypothetical protein